MLFGLVCEVHGLGAQSHLAVHKLQHFLSVSLQAVQPDPEEADHAEGAGQRSDLGGHRRQTPGQTESQKLSCPFHHLHPGFNVA